MQPTAHVVTPDPLPRYFGTDGIRGPIGDFPLTPLGAVQLGQAIGRVYRAYGWTRLGLGRDTRGSGLWLAHGVTAGLLSEGMVVFDGGIMPTPTLADAIGRLGLDGGIMITASHNPASDNGLKCMGPSGFKCPVDFEQAVEREIHKALVQGSTTSPWIPAYSMPNGLQAGYTACPDMVSGYQEACRVMLESIWTRWKPSSRPWVLDMANGATQYVLPDLFHGCPQPLVYMGNDPGPNQINAGCGAVQIQALQKQVVQTGAAWGAAFDGDGDRLVLVDETGHVVDGDGILYLMVCAYEAAGCAPRAVVGTVLTNMGLEQALTAKGIALYRTPVGDRWIAERLQAEPDLWLGGEPSGHVINMRSATTGDGIRNLLTCIQWMQETGSSLHTLLQPLRLYPRYTCQVPWHRSGSWQPWESHCPPAVLESIQGITAGFSEDGRVIIRPSGTEPVLRVMIECPDLGRAEQAGHQLRTLLESV